jgi:hypothetical protein
LKGRLHVTLLLALKSFRDFKMRSVFVEFGNDRVRIYALTGRRTHSRTQRTQRHLVCRGFDRIASCLSLFSSSLGWQAGGRLLVALPVTGLQRASFSLRDRADVDRGERGTAFLTSICFGIVASDKLLRQEVPWKRKKVEVGWMTSHVWGSSQRP